MGPREEGAGQIIRVIKMESCKEGRREGRGGGEEGSWAWQNISTEEL